jgi:hypothetical protein
MLSLVGHVCTAVGSKEIHKSANYSVELKASTHAYVGVVLLIGVLLQVVISQRSVACIDGGGQMYMAGTTADGEHFPAAQKLASLNNQKVVQAACAHSAVFALAETGRVWAWGRCASGLLGMTSRVAVFSPKALKFFTSGPSPREVAVRFLAAGVHHCAAISDGTPRSRES